MSYTGTHAFGLRTPIVKEGDDIVDIVMSSLNDAYNNKEYTPKENDIIGLTESIVARAEGKYVSVNDIVKDLENKFPNCGCVYVYNPIYSRNRFSIILRAIARYFDRVTIIGDTIDEVGNHIEHPITKVNYKDLYKEIIEKEGAEFGWCSTTRFHNIPNRYQVIDCTLHPEFKITDVILPENTCHLKDICNNVSEYGLLGSNKVDEETLKLFPDSKNQELVDRLKLHVQQEFGLKNVNVMIYGDGCYKDASSGIWEFADTVVSP